jgi:hypothetical protein
MEEHETRRKIIREWMTLPTDKRRDASRKSNIGTTERSGIPERKCSKGQTQMCLLHGAYG